MTRKAVCLLALFSAVADAAHAQEQVDKADVRKAGTTAIARLAVRVRATRTVPELDAVRIDWRRRGEGLGGEVLHGAFASEEKRAEIPTGAWSAWLPLESIVGRVREWEFPTLVVSTAEGGGRKKTDPLKEVVVEFGFAEDGKVFKTFAESAPKGATVGFAFPGPSLGEKGASDPGFAAQLQGLSGHARARRERLERLFPDPAPLLRQYAVIGHLAGYGEGAGYGIRHCNPEIVADECRALRLLGMNGLVGGKSVALADAAGMGESFRRIFWGGPGSGSPMGFLNKKGGDPADACPFDPAIPPKMAESVEVSIREHKASGAKESWALWWDEIGVAAKEHLVSCARCAVSFRAYARGLRLEARDLGKASWDEVTPYPLWKPVDPAAKTKGASVLAPAPSEPAEALRYYCTYRFMTYATALLFPESAKRLKEAGIPLYAMQGPTPSWSGHSLDWHEFYDLGANTAFVFETSNRDPRVWQWESYLADIGRGICRRHDMPFGCLVKPHRGAPEQRMLSVVSRGASVVEWYTYGPDYAKGDSFSQSPELLERVARAGRFLGRAEEYLHGATWAIPPEVAFVSPRSSEIWGKATDLGVTVFEDAKWVYLALRHAHVPLDILSEAELAEGKLDRYKALYVVGPNLRRDAALRVQEWVRAGGTLWTDAMGLSRDEANQPLAPAIDLLGTGARTLETWGTVEGYKATGLQPLVESAAPPNRVIVLEAGKQTYPEGNDAWTASLGRELQPEAPKDPGPEFLCLFKDRRPAYVRRAYGKGSVYHAMYWVGLTYSAKVRRPDFDMAKDLHPLFWITTAWAMPPHSSCRPVVSYNPMVETVFLEKDGRRSIALMNWSYRATTDPQGRSSCELNVARNLRIDLPGVGDVRSVRSLLRGPLTLEADSNGKSVVLPVMEEIDLLILE